MRQTMTKYDNILVLKIYKETKRKKYISKTISVGKWCEGLQYPFLSGACRKLNWMLKLAEKQAMDTYCEENSLFRIRPPDIDVFSYIT
jgi:hypothetical protein